MLDGLSALEVAEWEIVLNLDYWRDRVSKTKPPAPGEQVAAMKKMLKGE